MALLALVHCQDVSQPTSFAKSRAKTVRHGGLMFDTGPDESEDDSLLKLESEDDRLLKLECRSLPVAEGPDTTWDASPFVSLSPAAPTGDFCVSALMG